jgi:transcription initiation factor TFIIE subunit beta
MSSYLDKSQEAFQKAAATAAASLSNKRTLAPPPSAPSPAPSNASSKGDNKEQKRKREIQQPVVYSQPANSGYGEDLRTQITYTIEFLKKKDEPKSLLEILKYLGKVNVAESEKRKMAGIMRRHTSIEFIHDVRSKTHWDAGTFKHQPKINVRSKTDLLSYLQRKPDARGVSVADLKDGWPNCEDPITELEEAHEVLVTRTKKDNHARWVWLNDKSLVHSVDSEFNILWHKVELPNPDDLVRKLLDAGQKPASEDPSKRVKVAPVKKGRKKAVRKGGRTTNTHMEHLLRDYDHLKR